MHSVMGFEMGGFSIDFPTATVGALVPLFGGVFPLRSHSRVEEGERAGRAARIDPLSSERWRFLPSLRSREPALMRQRQSEKQSKACEKETRPP